MNNIFLTSLMQLFDPQSFQLASDIHLQFRKGKFDLPQPRAPYLALCGDIGLCCSQQQTGKQALQKFIQIQCGRFKQVWYVMGNHQSYSGRIEQAETFLESLTKKMDNFYLFNRGKRDIPGTSMTVLGVTLWSDVHPDATFCLNDFNLIYDFNRDQYLARHKTDLAWLRVQLGKVKPGRKVIVLTHHSPLADKRICPDDKDAVYCQVTLGIGGTKLPKQIFGLVDVWCYGHTHWNIDITEATDPASKGKAKCRIVTNQVCYPKDPYLKKTAMQFRQDLVIKPALQ